MKHVPYSPFATRPCDVCHGSGMCMLQIRGTGRDNMKGFEKVNTVYWRKCRKCDGTGRVRV